MEAANQTTQLRRTIGVMSSRESITLFAVVVLATVTPLLAQTPLGSGFTYQGQLDLLGTALNDTVDFDFTLWDAETGGNMIGSVWPVSEVKVIDDLFTVELDFGARAFNGEARWLEIDVRSMRPRCNSSVASCRVVFCTPTRTLPLRSNSSERV